MRVHATDSEQASATRDGFGLTECLVWLGCLLLTRLALVAVLARLTGGNEFTDDVSLHLSMMQEPLQILLGTHPDNAHFPPLMPLFESTLGAPLLAIFEPFIAMRLAYIALELVAFAATWPLMGAVWPQRTKRFLSAVWIIAPATWVASTVMAQEEMISAGFFAITGLLVMRRRLHAAIVVCSLGVVSAKIFFLVPLLALVAGPNLKPWRSAAARTLLAALPIVIVYGVATIFWRRAGLGLPLAQFTPLAELSTTFWAKVAMWTSLSLTTIKNASMLPALLGGLLPLIVFKMRGGQPQPLDLIRLATAMLLWVYALFYCISPEYYALLLPGLLVVLQPKMSAAVLIGMMSIAWSINFFYGVMNAASGESAGGKATFVRLYNAIFPIEPMVAHTVALALFVVLSFWLAVHVTVPLGRGGLPERAS